MKFYLLLLLFPWASFAQVSQGSFLVGGDISGSRLSQDATLSFIDQFNGQIHIFDGELKTTNLSLSPVIGYFVIDRLCFGMILPFSFSKSSTGESEPDFDYVTKSKSNSYNPGPFVRYYFPLSGKISAVAQGAYGWGYEKSTYTIRHFYGGVESRVEGEVKQKYKRVNLSAGCAYFMNPKTGLEFFVTYAKSNYEGDGGTVTGVSAQIGLQIYLSK
jgi:hypothetical protein